MMRTRARAAACDADEIAGGGSAAFQFQLSPVRRDLALDLVALC
jgi:hypothetical protein